MPLLLDLFGVFACLLGCRVGEASNPGPGPHRPSNECVADRSDKKLRFTVCNPSAIHGKVNDFAELGSHVYFVAETSATLAAQKIFTKESRKHGFTPYFSAPCTVKRDTVLSRPSLRGEAYGSMVLSSIPCRKFRERIDPIIWESGRISFSILRIGNREILACSIYGFAAGHQGFKKSTEALLMYAFQIGLATKLPFVIGGDFNFPVQTSEPFRIYQSEGFFEINDFCKNRLGISLPPTCAQSTSNDTFIFHPWFAPYITGAWVDDRHLFSLHDPLCVELDFPEGEHLSNTWSCPRSWHEFDIPKDVLANAYDKMVVSAKSSDSPHFLKGDRMSFDESIRQWAQLNEEAVSKAVAFKHDMDPNRCPQKCLPPAFLGRCDFQQKVIPHQRGPPQGCKGTFSPDSECFSVKARQKTRQVRRIQSLILILKKHNLDSFLPDRLHGVLQEWNRIRFAPGYGRSWERWILAFEVVECVPLTLPSLDWLECAKVITELDAQTYAFIESSNRAKTSKFRVALDVSEGYSKYTYRYLRKPANPTLNDIAVTWRSPARLLRSNKQSPKICVDSSKPWQVGSPAFYGDCEVVISEVSGQHVSLQVTQGVVPANADLVQHAFAYTPQHVAVAFRDFWSPFWSREDYDEQFDDDSWSPLIRVLDNLPHNVPNCHIDLDSPELWQESARGMKKGKATGADFFAPEDLHDLPVAAFRDFATIVKAHFHTGLSENFLVARTVLLAKIPNPETIKHGRPITIFGVLFRLITRHISRQLLRHWQRHLPIDVSGGVPGRGVQDLSLAQQSQIEHHLCNRTGLSGFTLDLVKAFNLLPRRAIVHIMSHFGAPRCLIEAWILCLSRMTRRVQIMNYFDEPLPCTTGVPEGDSLSVAAMVAVSWVFWLKISTPTVRAFCYADNWSWMTTEMRHNLICFRTLVDFTKMLRLQIDFDKSWAWVSSTAVQKSWDSISSELPEGIQIQLKIAVKDLGACVNYTRSRRVGPFRERFEEAMHDFPKLRYSRLSLREKCIKIQTALLPRAFYAADSCAPCESFFQTCRRSITNVLVTTAKHASSDIACHFLSNRLQDPFIFVLVSALRNLRRYFAMCPRDAMRIWCRACNYSGKRPFGPGTSLSVLVRRVGWHLTAEGCLVARVGASLDIFHSSNREITRFCEFWWTDVVHSRICHRKGFDFEQKLSRRILLRCFSSLSQSDQAFAAQYITGSFQTEQAKMFWDKTNTGLCPLCGKIDNHVHRVFECEPLGDIRLSHQHAVSLMKNTFKDWPWAPLPFRHPDEHYVKIVLENRKMPEPFQPELPADGVFTFYTDGSAHSSNQPFARHAAFAAIQDMYGSAFSPCLLTSPLRLEHTKFWIVSLAFCPGIQSVPRAELAAVVQVAMSMNQFFPDQACTIFTDAQYVINVVKNWSKPNPFEKFHKVNNQDLIEMLQKFWLPDKYSLVKVAAHKKVFEQFDTDAMRSTAGNCAADEAAKKARDREASDVKQALFRILEWDKKHGHDYMCVLRYLSELSRKRLQLMPTKKLSNDTSPNDGANEMDHAPQGAFDTLSTWAPEGPYQSVEMGGVSDEILQAMSGGSQFAWAVWCWLSKILWIQSDEPHTKSDTDFGITWVELLFNFQIVTGVSVPVFVEQHNIITTWVWPGSDTAALLPLKLKCVAAQIPILEGCIRQLQTLTGKRLTWGPRGKPPSLWHMGFFQRKNGFLRRPIIPCAYETMVHLRNFLQTCSPGFADLWHLPIPGCDPPPPIHLQDLDPRQRRKHYERCLAQRRNGGG